jgi:hypothetical protein
VWSPELVSERGVRAGTGRHGVVRERFCGVGEEEARLSARAQRVDEALR